MKDILAVFLGSGLGGVLRYFLSVWFKNDKALIPYHTLIANLLACLLVGFFFTYFSRSNFSMKLFTIIGFCGGLSTYSTYGYELFDMIENQNVWPFLLYSTLTFVLCLLAVFLGVWIAQSLSQ